jgi:hypothetical protein
MTSIPKDLEGGQVVMKRRDATDKKAFEAVKWDALVGRVPVLLHYEKSARLFGALQIVTSH